MERTLLGGPEALKDAKKILKKKLVKEKIENRKKRRGKVTSPDQLPTTNAAKLMQFKAVGSNIPSNWFIPARGSSAYGHKSKAQDILERLDKKMLIVKNDP